MSKNYKLSDLKYSIDKGFNFKINLGEDLLTISSLEILELSKIILTEFQKYAKMPTVALTAANTALKTSISGKKGRPKGSKNKIKK